MLIEPQMLSALHAWTQPNPFAAGDLLAVQLSSHAFFAQAGGTFSFLLMLLQTFIALGIVCGLAILIFRYVLPRLHTMRAANSMVRIVDRTALDARKSLYVIEIAGRWMLVGSSEAGVQLISELDAETAEQSAAALERSRPSMEKMKASARQSFAEQLARITKGRR